MVRPGHGSKNVLHPSVSREVRKSARHAPAKENLKETAQKPRAQGVAVSQHVPTPQNHEPTASDTRQTTTAMAPAPAAVDANDKLIAETTSLNQTTTTMAPIPAVVDLTDETVAESLEAASRETSADARPAWFDSDAKREPHSRSDSLNLGFERGQPYLVSNNIMLPTHSYAHGYDAYGLPLAASQEQTYAFSRGVLDPRPAPFPSSLYPNYNPQSLSTSYGPSHSSLPQILGYPLTSSPPPGKFNASTQTSLPSMPNTQSGSQQVPVEDSPTPLLSRNTSRSGNHFGFFRPVPRPQSDSDSEPEYKVEVSLRPAPNKNTQLPMQHVSQRVTQRINQRVSQRVTQQFTQQATHQPSPSPDADNKRQIYNKLSLSEFRLIRIRPLASGPLKLTLRPTPIHRPPSYTALSYAWGDNRDSVEVEVNGVPLDITKNLFEALRALQAPDKEVLCWADALAINQKDKEEVTAQVQMMKKIYSAASSVAIWLGMDFADSELALALIKKLSDNTSARNEGILQQLVKSRDHQPAFTALVSLFEREYWRRLWVVQEVLNARHVTVLCGSSSIPWSTYQQAADVLQKLSTLIDQTYSSWLCDGVDSVYISPKSRMSYSEVFLHLGPASFQDVESLHLSGADLNDAATALKLQKALCMCRSKFATDARDKVYGLLGVLPDDVQKHIVPDYSLSIKDVFTKAAEYIILKRKRLDVLGNAFHFPVHISPLGLPSWVPDWSHISHMTPVDWPAGRFSASASTTSKADIDSQNHRVLSTWAIEVDQVVEPGIPVCTINTVNNFILSFLHWYAMLQKHLRESNEAQKERAEDAFCRTLALDGIHPLFQAPGKWRTVTLHLFASLAEENLPELPLPPRLAEFAKDGCVDLHGVSRNAILQEVFSPSMTGRSFFFSRSGIMGMGSGYLSAGDVAVVPLGCSTPLLLRKDPDTDEYRFVSDAYLDGYMYGKAITDWSSGLLEPDRYIIH